MKLVDLNPRWVGIHGWSSPEPYYIGLTFDLPLRNGQRLAVLFEPAIDPARLAEKYQFGTAFPNARKWQRTGDTFETLTLSPSLDFSNAGEWHGFITGGEIR